MQKIKLSALTQQIQETIQSDFGGTVYLITAQITDVNKREIDQRCYLKFVEKEQGKTTAEIRAVFWRNYYHEIELFEKATNQPFSNGIEITCQVKVRFHPIYGLNLDVIKIDVAHALGSLELERQQTLDRLLKENQETIQQIDGIFRTPNKALSLPLVIKNIALITAQNSDGQRDFLQEIKKNKHGYHFSITEFLVTIQGDHAHDLILEQLKIIKNNKIHFDVVAIVRGGGSQTDFRPFDHYDLVLNAALFPIPIMTGIGHDRNTSLVDLMVREQKTPTKVAASIVDHNFEFENELIEIKSEILEWVSRKFEKAKKELEDAKRIIKLSSPKSILERGFAILMKHQKIITNPKHIKEHDEIQILLQDEFIDSLVTKKQKNEKHINL